MKFITCNGECTFEGPQCEGCGHSHKETLVMGKPIYKEGLDPDVRRRYSIDT